MLSRLVRSSLQVVARPSFPSSAAKFVPVAFAVNTRVTFRGFSTNDGKDTASSEDAAPAADDAAAAAEPVTVEATVVDTSVDKIAALEKEVKHLKDQLLRSYAEEENVRRIARRDVDLAKAYSSQGFAKAMLEVADDLERGLGAIPADKKTAEAGADPMLLSLIEGVEMTEKNLVKIFKKFEVVRFGEVDEVFDPNSHEALFQMPDPSKPAGTIAQVVKAGYRLKDRVIRPAEVGVRFHP